MKGKKIELITNMLKKKKRMYSTPTPFLQRTYNKNLLDCAYAGDENRVDELLRIGAQVNHSG